MKYYFDCYIHQIWLHDSSFITKLISFSVNITLPKALCGFHQLGPTMASVQLLGPLCDSNESDIHFLSRKCMESRKAFYLYNCRRVTQSESSETACLVWTCISLTLGVVGNTMTLTAIPYAKMHRRFLLWCCNTLFWMPYVDATITHLKAIILKESKFQIQAGRALANKHCLHFEPGSIGVDVLRCVHANLYFHFCRNFLAS